MVALACRQMLIAVSTARVENGTLDESPMAYKDIFEVMRLQHDLVDMLYHITPMINVKG